MRFGVRKDERAGMRKFRCQVATASVPRVGAAAVLRAISGDKRYQWNLEVMDPNSRALVHWIQ